MKEYENGFTTKAMLDENNGKKSSYGEQINVNNSMSCHHSSLTRCHQLTLNVVISLIFCCHNLYIKFL